MAESLLLLCVCAVSGCGGGGSSNGASSRLVGIWLQTAIAVSKVGSADCSASGAGRVLTSAQGVQYACAAGTPNVSFFNADGSYQNYASGTTSGSATPLAQGTWQLRGGALRIVITSPLASPAITTGTVTFQDVPTTEVGGLSGQTGASGGVIGTAPSTHTFTLTYTSGPYTGFTSTYELSNAQ